MMIKRIIGKQGRIGACCALATIAAAGAVTPAQAAPMQADFKSAAGNAATGVVQGGTVDLRPTTASGKVWDVPTSRTDNSWPYFAGPTFSPSLPQSDVIQIGGAAGAAYTITFRAADGRPLSVKDPVLHLGSLGSTLNFTTGTPTLLSGENNLRVSGSQVIGVAGNQIGPSGNSDSSGSVKISGSHTQISFTATPNYVGPADGILVQLVTEPGTVVTDPGTGSLGPMQGTGECTDWALYRRPDLKGIVTGDAKLWAEQARSAGRPVSKTVSVGAVMVFQGGVLGAFADTGHVAYVESVQRDAAGNPTSFVISEQNYNGSKSPTSRPIQVRELPATGIDFIAR